MSDDRAAERPSGTTEHGSLPFALQYGPAICLIMIVLAALTTAGLAAGRSALPLWFDLWMGAMSLGTLACGYAQLRSSALLQCEGLRLQATVIDRRFLYGIDHTAVAPVVRIEGSHLAGRVVRLSWRSRKDVASVGSCLPILAHPTRAMFDTDEPRPHLAILLVTVIFGLACLLLPAWVEWQMAR